jgi:pimeloyl-ACP methyl ester carboxylesterase
MTNKTEVTKIDRGFTKEVWFIHGANASPASFNHIKKELELDPELNDYNFVDITYDCQEDLKSIVSVLAASAPKNKQFYMVGHSLGGVLAAAVSQKIKQFELPVSLRGVVSLASPFGGSESADYLRWMYPHYYLFRSISTQSRIITDVKAVGAVVPTLSIVTTSGNNPLFPSANDGVVTVASQRALPKATYIEMPYNHFEILVSKETVDHIKLFLKSK